MSQILTEDDIYRTSTQYRLWSFTPESLSSLRENTNEAAASHVLSVAEIREKEAQQTTDEQTEDDAPSNPPQPNTLTPAESTKLITYHTQKLLLIGSSSTYRLSRHVSATAAQFFKRFYLSNSPMLFPPKTIIPVCLFLAAKCENALIPVKTFAERWKPKPLDPKEDVLDLEQEVIRGLRFSFQVRHPQRGLRGVLMELCGMAKAQIPMLHGLGKSEEEIQREMLKLPPAEEGDGIESGADTKARIDATIKRAFIAHDNAKEVLATKAQLTDAYFLYTPSQIMLASLLLADEPLTRFYLLTKIPSPANTINGEDTDGTIAATDAIIDKIFATIQTCAEMLSSQTTPDRTELVEIDKKLYYCLLPQGKVNTEGGIKRNGNDMKEVDLKTLKKRKLEREKAKKDGEVFGGPLEKEEELIKSEG